MEPPSEHVHWMFATGFLVLAACLLAQAIVGDDVWNRSAWRRYFFPGFGFLMGLAMWPVAVFAGGTTIHLLAHFTWAQLMMLAGGAHLALARGKLQHRFWRLTMPVALEFRASRSSVTRSTGGCTAAPPLSTTSVAGHSSSARFFRSARRLGHARTSFALVSRRHSSCSRSHCLLYATVALS